MRKRIYNRAFKSKPIPQTTKIKCCECDRPLKDFEVTMNFSNSLITTAENQKCSTCILKEKRK